MPRIHILRPIILSNVLLVRSCPTRILLFVCLPFLDSAASFCACLSLSESEAVRVCALLCSALILMSTFYEPICG